MTLIKQLKCLLFVICAVSLWAADQSTPYILTDFPITLIPQDSAVWIKWAGISRTDIAPDSGVVYYNSTPGGSIIDNYSDSVHTFPIHTIKFTDSTIDTIYAENIYTTDGPIPQRGIKFSPVDNGMGAGVYYLIVGLRTKVFVGLVPVLGDSIFVDTTFYSNEIQFIVEADEAAQPLEPERADTIEELTPTFKWVNNPGVPYYHIIVSDEKISVDMDNESISGLSIVWQAITSNTQITYGAPDPSGTITADPPPLSPGNQYSWVVLNNYGNHMAYSSTRFSMPWSFTLAGLPLNAPSNVSPVVKDSLNNKEDSLVTLKWTNLDSSANTYKIYIYVGSDFEGIEAQMVVWSNEVTAGEFITPNSDGSTDTASITFNAKSILTSNYYTWKVIAIDKKGAGTIGNLTGFYYSAPTGIMKVTTAEKIVSGDKTINKYVGLVEIKVEVLDGSMEAPLLFYTDNDGYLSRERPIGTYRLTALKVGFVTQSKNINLTTGVTSEVAFVLERPDATVFGSVVNKVGGPINLASVYGVSDRGDTVVAETDPLGSFILNCYEADWSIYAKKEGYITSLFIDTSVTFGQSVELNTSIVLRKNPFILSGIIQNSVGEPLLGANVKLLIDGSVIAEIPSTPQSGAYSFSVESGTYILSATKTGFTSYSNSFDVLSSMVMKVTMKAGAALVKGFFYGQSYNSSFAKIYAPITNATVFLVDTSTTPSDTFSTISDKTYGDFSISVEGGKIYKLFGSKIGYVLNTLGKDVITYGGKTLNINDTMTAFSSITGTVRMSDTASSKAANVTVSIVESNTNKIIAITTSDALGTFELREIPDGIKYRIQAGAIGLIKDSILLIDTANIAVIGEAVYVVDGLLRNSDNNKIVKTISVMVESGSKNVNWLLLNGLSQITNASIKLKSPIQKNIASTDTLAGVGPGSYIMGIDADADSILDCSYHIYAIDIGPDTLHTDTVNLPAIHHAVDSISVNAGVVTLTVSTKIAFSDSGEMFYKDLTAQSYNSQKIVPVVSGTGSIYTFLVKPTKDGSYMEYYFRLTRGSNVFGYAQEINRTYVRPDPTTLSKVNISSGGGDTLMFATGTNMEFSFSGYYGSKYMLVTNMTKDNVGWSVVNDPGNTCQIIPHDSGATLIAKSGVLGSVMAVKAVFKPTAGLKLGNGVNGTVLAYFKVSSSVLDSIFVDRIDADTREYITTAQLDNAIFSVKGFDREGVAVSIYPVWEIHPLNAGVISNGIFNPNDNFLGHVRIMANVGKVTGEYNPQSGKKINAAGLDVHCVITSSGGTIESYVGCKILLPKNIIDSGKVAELAFKRPVISNNKINLITGDCDVLGDAYDIAETRGVAFNTNILDSITVILDIPKEYHNKAKTGKSVFYVASWNPDSVAWFPDSLGTVIAADGKTATLKVTHFSRYALLHKAGATDAEFIVKPNPFSPFVRAIDIIEEYGPNAPYGTCLSVRPSSKHKNLNFTIRIFNVVGNEVWSVILQGANSSNEYKIFWDGRTLSNRSIKDLDMNEYGFYIIRGNAMCRNGRYFAVLTLDDGQEEKHYTKQIILFK